GVHLVDAAKPVEKLRTQPTCRTARRRRSSCRSAGKNAPAGGGYRVWRAGRGADCDELYRGARQNRSVLRRRWIAARGVPVPCVLRVCARATFFLFWVDGFRRVGPPATDRHSGVGGYPVLVELLLPTAHDPDGQEGRERLGLAALDNEVP